MGAFVAGLMIFAGVLTLLCALWRRRSMFSAMMFGLVAYFIALNFASEAKSPGPIAIIGATGILFYAGLCGRALWRLWRNPHTEAWVSAGVSENYLLIAEVELTGRQARVFWVMQAVCAGLITVGLSCGLAVAIQRKAKPSDPAARGVRVVHFVARNETSVYVDLKFVAGQRKVL